MKEFTIRYCSIIGTFRKTKVVATDETFYAESMKKLESLPEVDLVASWKIVDEKEID